MTGGQWCRDNEQRHPMAGQRSCLSNGQWPNLDLHCCNNFDVDLKILKIQSRTRCTLSSRCFDHYSIDGWVTSFQMMLCSIVAWMKWRMAKETDFAVDSHFKVGPSEQRQHAISLLNPKRCYFDCVWPNRSTSPATLWRCKKPHSSATRAKTAGKIFSNSLHHRIYVHQSKLGPFFRNSHISDKPVSLPVLIATQFVSITQTKPHTHVHCPINTLSENIRMYMPVMPE